MTDSTTRDVIDLSGPSTRTPDAELSAVPVADAPKPEPIPVEELAQITDEVIVQLKTVYDPEIPVDIYELGLIYKVDLEDDRTLKVVMSLTAPGCPVAGEMPGWVQDAVERVEGVNKATVELTFDPPWTPDRMSDEARLSLNMF
ncbi:SUF system Fe-S cluster assembly protein [uncultured Maricaulis sp.]|uniref:SUF system Fe-S cluster assembly protein n=1 Tax=uncultured Maricaulis sp. TaxID=174710 RepID=UPI0030DCA863|tara:strand:+ start:9160 stop:9591 length:432 start_codon:yes stop_codon:yes gene_type:complete